MTDSPDRFLSWLRDENGYRDVRELDGKRWAATQQLMFTCAILVGQMFDPFGYDDRWCYATHAKALAALEAWSGQGEPTGWHRHPNSGRRVDAHGKEYVAP